jgi:hypothetical protein
MSDRALELFEQYLDQRASGQSPDAAALVHEAGDQADVLAGMIAAYAATHPADVTENQLEQMAARPELEPSRPWSELLPALRERTHTTRATLVSRLCEALGVPGSEWQVGDYVHELEAGLLSPARVRPAVVSALAAVLGVPRALLESSRGMAAESPPLASTTFARFADHADDGLMSLGALDPDPDPEPDPRVDDLFTGGGDG